ncbi:MAG: hypothetical protein ABSA97_15585 [Verrucomicrobiia bacterium]
MVEFSVVQHFGPNAIIDYAPEMFDELAVHVLRDRRASFADVNRDGDGLSLRVCTYGEGKESQTDSESGKVFKHDKLLSVFCEIVSSILVGFRAQLFEQRELRPCSLTLKMSYREPRASAGRG